MQANQVVRELLSTLTAQACGMWRYRWRAVIVMWAISILGWIFVYSLPPVYEANARIYVDTENAIRPLLQGIASSSNVMSEVTVVTREMLSRPNLAEVARTTDLDLRVEGDAQFESLLASLQKRIQVVGGRDNIFSISFEDQDRTKAIAVVEALVNTFVEKSLGADRSESREAQSFLQEQIDEYEARLTAAEDNLAQFKRDNIALMPGQGGDYFARLQEAESGLGESTAALRLALERRDELLRQIEGEEPVFGIMGTTPASSGAGGGFSGAKIRELESQLEELRLQYTDKHPRIGQILQTIELLKEQQAEERAAAAVAGDSRMGTSPLEQNPVFQNMRIQLTNTEVEIASLRADVNERQRQVAELRTLVDTVPQVEAELGRLNRDYGVVKAKYEQLLEQLETANIGEDVEQSIDDVQFRIIDPPFSALEPSGPQRQLLLAGVLIIALGAGGALTFLLNQVHPVFFTSREIRSGIGIPVLGTVSLFSSPSELSNRRSGHVKFLTAIGFLVLSFALVSLFSGQLSPLVRGLVGLRI
jgi:polysaccharide chain length determinant protein (PEP-CTERM system associated)